MSELKLKLHDAVKSLEHILDGDYYVPVIELSKADDCPIGKWRQMHKAYLEETSPLLLEHLILTGKIHTYFANLNKQTQDCYQLIIRQMMEAEGVTEDLKR